MQQFHKYSTFWKLNNQTFNKPLIFYQFQRNIQPRIHQASDLLSISEHYPPHNSTSLWFSINFKSIIHPSIQQASDLISISAGKYSPSFIKPLIFYQFQSIIHPSIQQASSLLSNSVKYTLKYSHYIQKNSNSYFIRSIQNMKPYILHIIKYLNTNAWLIS